MLVPQKEMAIRSIPEFNIDRLVERMKVGARRQSESVRAVAATGEDGSGTQAFAPEAKPVAAGSQVTQLKAEPLALQPPFTPHADDCYHVNDLLQFSDRNFIQNAYLAILKRGPDATGYRSFMESLGSGRLNKMDVLARLRYSTEGRAKKVRIDGLLFPALVRLSYQVPVIGYLVNLAVGLARLPTSIRHLQKFEAHVLAQQELIAAHANRGSATLAALAGEVSEGMVRLRQSAAGVAEQHKQEVESLIREQQQLAVLAREQRQSLESFTADQHRQIASLAGRHEEVESAAREHRQYLEAFTREQRERIELLATEQQQLTESLAAGQQRYLETFVAEQQQDLARTHAQLEHFQKLVDGLQHDTQLSLSHFREESTGVEQRFEKQNAQRQTIFELLAKELRAELAHVFGKQQEIRSELVLQAQRVNVLLEKAQRQIARPRDKDLLRTMAAEADHTLDALYFALEAQFRGSRDEIKERLKVYLPLISAAGIGKDEMPVLDVGCGRGEWLELLDESGLIAGGIDSNRLQVAHCRELGLDVTEAELLSHLRGVPDVSLGAVTGFHIVEHLPVEALVALLDEAVRVVKPGGAVIFETPNPENVLVGSCNFYFDPTHRNPLPSPVLKFLLESRGFQRVQILHLNPSDEALVKGNTELTRRFNEYFYGPMDYAVIGWRA